MKRFQGYIAGLLITGLGTSVALAGQASTNAWAGNGIGHPGTAGASANYDGNGGQGIARTRTDTGDISFSRGLAVGVDRDGLDFSFSHALAPKFGPSYAGTYNMSIGRDGEVSSGYGGVLATGGLARDVEAGGSTSSSPYGDAAVTHAQGNTVGGGRVVANTHTTNSGQPYGAIHQPVRVQRSPHGVTARGAQRQYQSYSRDYSSRSYGGRGYSRR